MISVFTLTLTIARIGFRDKSLSHMLGSPPCVFQHVFKGCRPYEIKRLTAEMRFSHTVASDELAYASQRVHESAEL